MALEEYARKRSFEQTPEPGPEVAASATGRLFCVQRHLARRLHYDFRLEIGGTLKSWAVPQGPSLDPAHKRLAVMVEDHPHDYATFEGNIPKGNYGAGSVMLWDIGTFEVLGDKTAEEQIARGDFKFRLRGKKLGGEYAIVRMKTDKGNEWLMLKKKDAFVQAGYDIEQNAVSVATGRTQEEIAQELPSRLEAAPAGEAMPDPFEPMLATAADAPPLGPEWYYEIKWDGVRALAYLDSSGTRLYTRKKNRTDRQYPELSVLHNFVGATEAILDGEIVAVDEQGRPSFERLQPRIMASDPNAIAQLARTRPALYYAFDIVWLDGRDLRDVPLSERKRLLRMVVRPSPSMRISDHFEGAGRELLEPARAQGLEGIVAKLAASRYRLGRVRDWVKVKVFHEQEFVLAGYTHGERDFFGALVLGIFDEGRFVWAGNVGTGFDRKLMEAIRQRLDVLATDRCPFEAAPKLPDQIQWVKPELVCSVKFVNWTDEKRLRAPVFVGLRTDIDPCECTFAPPEPKERPPLFEAGREEMTVTVEGQALKIKNLGKVWYPDDAITKRDILNYYDAVADFLLPHWTDRPLSLRRYPDGIAKEGFFQKNAATGFPEWVRMETILAEDGRMRHQVIGSNRAALLWIVQLGCIDQNPWMSSLATLDHPDYVLIDLDPSDCGYARIVEAALWVRRKLDRLGLVGYPKTTGGDGLHIYVPLEPVYTYEQSRSLAEILARIAAAERPDLFTLPRATSKREKGKVYFDYMQNARGKTISAPYVPRAHPGAPVATPLDWRELTPSLHPSQFTIRNAVARFERVGDLFGGVLTNRQRLEPAMERLPSLLDAPERSAGR